MYLKSADEAKDWQQIGKIKWSQILGEGPINSYVHVAVYVGI